MSDSLSPPVATRVPVERTHHGDTVVDEYEWLRAKEDPAVIAHLEAENAYAAQQTAHLADLREALFGEIKQRTQETDLSTPTRRGDWWYYTRTAEGASYSVHCRCPAGPIDDVDAWTPPTLQAGVDVPGEVVLLDCNAAAAGHEFFSLGGFDVSPDGTVLAHSTDVVGDERYTVRFTDLRTGEDLPDEIVGTSGGVTWSLDGSVVLYTVVDDSWRPHRVLRHRLGVTGDESADEVVFEEPDDRYWVGVGSTRSERYLVIAVGSKVTTELRVLEADDPLGEFRVVEPRREGVDYSLEHAVVAGQDRFLILHNDGAVNFELAEAPADSPGREHWRILVAHDEAVRLESVDAFAGHLALSYRREALSRVDVWPLTSQGYGERREIRLDEELFAIGTGGNPEWQQPTLRIGFGSYVTPTTIADHVVATGELLVRKRQPVLGGFDAADYEQHREWAVADDGTRIPLSVVCRRGTPRDGTAPTLLYGYGSYEISMDPGLSVSRLSLLDRGMVFVVAHVRGGGEMGRHWYDDGKQLTKRNTFTDFVSAARHLVDSGWTSTDRLVAQGGSAGGLLMGAVANLAPDAFAGIAAIVPFVDNLTSILDPSLPLTVIEWDEWGDPLHDPQAYAYIKSYAPYDNVRDADYPPILAVTSLNDTRVLYVEPAKWVARLRERAPRTPVLLKTEMSAGHGGVSGRYEAWRELAYVLAWMIDTAGAPHAPLPGAGVR